MSVREAEVLALVADGRSSLEIATALHLSVNTVNSYAGSACSKLGTRSRAHAAFLAAKTERGCANGTAALDALTDLHIDLLLALASGCSLPDAARAVHVSVRTAYRRLEEAQRHLGAITRVGAMLTARDLGLLGPRVRQQIAG